MHKTTITVRYAETDRMGVAYYANYLVWFEVARTEFLESYGVSYKDIEEKNNLHLMVAESYCKYLSPVTYNDKITVETQLSQIKNSSLAFDYRVSSAGRLVAEGKTRHVFTNKEGRPTKIPQELKSIFSRSEAKGY